MRRAALAGLLVVPGLLTALLSFRAGGLMPGVTALVAAEVLLLLALRLGISPRSVEAVSLPAVVAGVALGGFAAWTLASGTWSDAPGRARVEYDRALLYLAVFALFATVPFSVRRLSWMLYGVAVATVVVCAAAAGALLLPDIVQADPGFRPDRLGFPLTYWNALGVLAGIGIVLCGHLACSDRGPAAARVFGAAAIPLLSVTLLATSSRGATWAALGAVLVYCVLGRPRGVPAAALATIGPTVLAGAAVNPISRFTRDPSSAAAVEIGHDVALTVLLCMVAAGVIRVLLLRVDRRLASVRVGIRVPRAVAVASVAVLVLSGAFAAVSFGVSDLARDQYAKFADDGDKPGGGGSSRLFSASNNGRIEHWNVALAGFREDRVRGQGAGTYELLWARDRPNTMDIRDAHSLYLEVLGELGLVGLVLLVVGLGTILGAFAFRARGPDRALFAALLAAGLVWAVHAGIDWDWEMPAVTLWLFALGGAATARRPGRARRPALGVALRVTGVLLCVVLAAGPAQVALAQADQARAEAALNRGDCPRAQADARDALAAVADLTAPRQILIWCAMREGRPRVALDAARDALAVDPRNWRLQHALVVTTLATGRRAGLELDRLAALNPRASALPGLTDLVRMRDRRLRTALARSVQVYLP